VRKKHGHLEEHLESFTAKCRANGYCYADWDAAFMEAIRSNWARIGEDRGGNGNGRRAPLEAGERDVPEYVGETLPEISDEERQATLKKIHDFTSKIGGAP
jgi:hypothetical protein